MKLDVRSIAAALGGEVSGKDAVLAPGPGHSPQDRSLSVKLCAIHQDGFVVHSFAGDPVNLCRDHVKAKIGLPAWRPRVSISRDLGRERRRSFERTNGHHAAPMLKTLTDEAAIVLPAVALPTRTTPDATGKPKFIAGEIGPPARDEVRRHVYKRDGIPVRIKIKNDPARSAQAYTQWFRVVGGWQAARPDGYVPCPYVGECDPFDPETVGDRVFWPEGERDVDTVTKAGGLALCFGGVGDGLPDGIERFLAGRDVVILNDNDDPGAKHGARKADIALPVARSVRLVAFPELAEHGDVTDWFAEGGSIDALHDRADAAPVIAATSPATQHQNDDAGPRLDVRRMSDVAAVKTEWLWPGRIAVGKQTLLGGEPGLGKSQLTAALAATVTTGGDWPCGEGRAPLGSVVILSAEDDAADTIRPRLDAAGADASRVYQIAAVEQHNGKGRRVFNLQADLHLLEKTIEDVGDVRLVIIDPVSSYMGKTDSHKNADVRGTLEPLGDMAARLRVAVVSITHFSKGSGNTALNSFIGSIAFVAAARAAFMVTRDPDSDDPARRLFITAKNNLAVDSGGLAFRIEQHLLPGEIVASAIVWDHEWINRTADEVLAAVADDKAGGASRAEAENFLTDLLQAGPVPVREIEADAKGAGIAWRTVRRAQKALGVRAERRAESGDGLGKAGRWYWCLPGGPEAPKVANSSYDGHVLDVATLGSSGHLRGEGWR